MRVERKQSNFKIVDASILLPVKMFFSILYIVVRGYGYVVHMGVSERSRT